MQTPAVHHLVTIRLEDHVQQLEQTYRALMAVRAHVSEVQQSLEHVSLHIIVPSPAPEELRMALHRLRTTSNALDVILKTIQPPDCGPSGGTADVD